MNGELGRIEGRMTGVEKELQTLNRVLIGNGQPGVMERMTRAEENIVDITVHTKEVLVATGDLAKIQAAQTRAIDSQSEQIVAQSEQIGDLSGSVRNLADAVKTHCGDDNKHTPKGLLLRKEVLAVFILAVLVIVTIVSSATVSVWDLVLKYIGL